MSDNTPAEVVVRPDQRRYRRYFALRWIVIAVLVAACLVLAVVLEHPGAKIAMVFLAIGWLVLGAIGLTWQRRTYLDPEPALILSHDALRILHKGEHLWVPWTDVSAVRSYTMNARGQVVELLIFDLVPEARHKLPTRRASLADRLMTWRTNDLVYSRPRDTPRFEEVERVARRLHDQATGGHQLRAAQRAHWPEHLREGGTHRPPGIP